MESKFEAKDLFEHFKGDQKQLEVRRFMDSVKEGVQLDERDA